MAKSRKTKNLDRWVKFHQWRHICECGCGDFIEIQRHHHKASVGIPKFIKGHNLSIEYVPPVEEIEVEKGSVWDRLAPEEQQRRLSLLKSFGTGNDNPAWKGGRVEDEHGYVKLRMPNHPYAKDGYIFEHRHVVEQRTLRDDPNNILIIEINGVKCLSPVAVVHHIDEVKNNNEESNLMLLPNQNAHVFIHRSSLSMEEKIRRIKLGIYHSRPLKEDK
jgi:hypothetical protein